jgi:radical SAM superfamily enzyme YgiQ (UPF0313 family)
MKVMLVNLNRQTRAMRVIPLGIGYVGAAVEASGHRVKLVDLGAYKDPLEGLEQALQEFQPGAIGLSLRNLDEDPTLANFAKVKRYTDLCQAFVGRHRTVIGGTAFSMYPEHVIRFFDLGLGVVGEGEQVLVHMLDCWEAGSEAGDIPGVVTFEEDVFGSPKPRQLIGDLDGLPCPLRELTGFQELPKLNIQGKRGCPFTCVYCGAPALEGRRWRVRSPALVAEEIERLARDIPGAEASIIDANFNWPPDHAMEVCQQLVRQRVKIKWEATLHPQNRDSELIQLMTRAGCCSVYIGVESASEEQLARLRRSATPQDVVNTVGLCDRAGLEVSLTLLIGGPGENRRTVEETLAVVSRLSYRDCIATLGINVHQSDPLAALAREEGAISPDADLFYPRVYCSPQLQDLDLRAMLEAAGVHGYFNDLTATGSPRFIPLGSHGA